MVGVGLPEIGLGVGLTCMPMGRSIPSRIAGDGRACGIEVGISRPEPFRYDRMITVFRRIDGAWRRSDEHHRNVTFDVDEALRILRDNGIDARSRAAFGEERLPDGLVVLCGIRR